MKKRILCLILACLMLIPLIVSCSKDDETEETGNGAVTTNAADETVNLPYKDFDGKEFKLLVSTSDYGLVTFSAETYGDTAIDQAIFNRNSAVESRLDMKVLSEEIDPYEIVTKIDMLCSSGTFEYDAFVPNMNVAVPLVQKGYFADASVFDGVIDMSQPWWDQTAANGLRVNGKVYSLIGDAIIHYFESSYLMVYNKDYAETLGIPNLAELALEGDWTLEALNTYMKQGHEDKNNNSAKDSDDIYGLAAGGAQFIDAALLCSGETILDYDEDNYPSFKNFTERTMAIFSYVQTNLTNGNDSFIAPRDNTYLGNADDTWHDVFIKNRALFYAEPVGSLQKLKDVSFEFTILPVPKYEAEDSYRTLMLKFSEGLFVPLCTPNYEDTGIILENLMYESYVTVRPTYFETVASLPRVRNDDSYRVMSEIVWNSPRVISLLQIYNWGDMENQIVSYCLNGQQISGLGASLGRAMNKYIEKSIGAKQQ